MKSTLPYEVMLYNNLDPERLKGMRTKFIDPNPNNERNYVRENLASLANIYKAHKNLG